MKYKIGFFYNIVTGLSYHRNRLILSFTNGHLEFKLFNPELLPHGIHLSNMSYYNFDYPVIYEQEGSEIVSLTFLKEIEICAKPEVQSGFCFSEPTQQMHSASLFLDGKEIFPIDKISATSDIMFYRTIIHSVAVLKHINAIDTRTDIFIDSYIDKIKAIKTYVDSIDINIILKDLQISVYDYLREKRGDDDYYYIYKNVSVNDEQANKDDYLKRTIGIGENLIYKDSGYTSHLKQYAESFLNENPLGVYTGQLLEEEKQKIISNYSKEEHVGFLVAKYFVDKQFNRTCILPSWSKVAKQTEDLLYNDFLLNKISNSNREFERNMYPLEDKYSNAQDELKKINESIKDITKYHGKYSSFEDNTIEENKGNTEYELADETQLDLDAIRNGYTIAKESIGSEWNLKDFTKKYGVWHMLTMCVSKGVRTYCIFTDKKNQRIVTCVSKVFYKLTQAEIVSQEKDIIIKVLDSRMYCMCKKWEEVDLGI